MSNRKTSVLFYLRTIRILNEHKNDTTSRTWWRYLVEGDTTSTSSEFENELDENKLQFARIRDKNASFVSLSTVCGRFTKREFLVSILKFT